MEKKIRVLIFVAGLFLFSSLFFLFQIDWEQISSVQNIYLIFFAFLLFLASILVSSFKTNIFLSALNEKRISLIDSIKIEFINKFFYYSFPGKANVAAKAFLISKKNGMPKSHSFSLTSFEYFFESTTTLILAFFFIFFVFENKFSFVNQIENFIVFFLIIVAITCFFIVSKKTFEKINNFFEKNKIPFHSALFKVILGVRENWPKILFRKQIFSASIVILVVWLLNAFSTELVFSAYGTQVPLLWVFAISTTAVLVGGLSQIPGGMGTREITMVLLFGILGVSQETVLIVALVTRIFSIAPIIVGYFWLTGFGKISKLNS